MTSVKYARELAELFSDEHVFFLSQDDKARVPIGLPISKKQDVMLMHLEYKVSLPDHDFPIGKSHKLIPSVYASCNRRKENDDIGYSGPTYIAIRSGKHDKSCAASHKVNFQNILRYDRNTLKNTNVSVRAQKEKKQSFLFPTFFSYYIKETVGAILKVRLLKKGGKDPKKVNSFCFMT